ncbi:MAG: UPF0182 family protein [Bryobacteraceae bacterium]
MKPFRYVFLLLFVLIGGQILAGTWIDYEWWKEIGQLSTWYNMLIYGVAPVGLAGILASVALWMALARGLKDGGRSLRGMPNFAGLSVLIALVAGIFLASASIDSAAVVRWFGGQGVGGEAEAWRDPMFGKPLAFYLFSLPFYRVVYGFVLALAVVTALVYLVAARLAPIQAQLEVAAQGGQFDVRALRLESGWAGGLLRGAAALGLLAMAGNQFLNRYDLLMSDHGFLVGADYVDEHVRLPLLWALIGAFLISAAGVLIGRWKVVITVAAAAALYAVLPPAVNALYVRPNEIQLQKQYIDRHIQATRTAFGLDRRVSEKEFSARMDARPDMNKHKAIIDNIRLWDWRAFHDTVTQIQALRPYYVFADSDVDRYVIDGELRQVMLTPRELDIRQLPDAQSRWINPHFIYTHGYGMVMAEANRITADGLPHLLVQDAPPQLNTKSLKLTRPEIYYGEVTHEPLFVRSGQKEFSYPSGNESVFTRYEGTGGFPASSLLLRLAVAIRYTDFNVLLTNLFTDDSRMIIRRNVEHRLKTVAGFLQWDSDPYLVVTDEGRLIWTVDAYTNSNSHPYSSHIQIDGERVNYLRNSVKATVDAYNGTVALYIVDEADPVVEAYRRLFPDLFQPLSAMPANIRQHLRYPETLFRAQAEIYRLFHMRDPQTFYNKEDVWDIARNLYGNENRPNPVTPTYIVGTLPGETEPEFLLLLPFTPRNKDNLIGLMMARCDGEHLGELVFLQLSKQALVFGPMQMEARIDQDPEISKDLSLWSQKGSTVLRGQMLVLPVEDSFLYVEPIYIQAAEARMPQLKKVVLAMGNDLVYRDTYGEALEALAHVRGVSAPGGAVSQLVERRAQQTAGTARAPAMVEGSAEDKRRLGEIRERLRKYRELFSQGKYGDAGRELEAIEGLVR